MRSDEDLMVDAAQGDTGAFEEIVRRYQDMVWRMAARFIGDATEAEDIAQTDRPFDILQLSSIPFLNP